MTETDLREAAGSLRRTAMHVRASRQSGWLETAIELEALAIQRESEADALVGS